MCARYDPKSVLQIFVLTCASFGGMTLYAVLTKKDLTIFGSIISGASMLMLSISMLMWFYSTPALRMVYSGLAIMMALAFVAIDTQMILKNRKHGIGYDDYIRASVSDFGACWFRHRL